MPPLSTLISTQSSTISLPTTPNTVSLEFRHQSSQNLYSIRLQNSIRSMICVAGFESALMACCGYGGPPYNFDQNVECGAYGSQVCPVGSRYVNWDGIHYTEAANAVVASKILTTEFSKPKLRFDSFCAA